MIIVTFPKGGNTSLTKLFGFPCESRFTVGKPVPEMHELKMSPHYSEVSWLAAPCVPEMLAAGAPLLHVARHPLRAIARLCAMGFWTTEHKAYREFVIDKVPECTGLSPVDASAMLWLHWSRFCDGAPRIQIEDIVNAPRLNVGARFEVKWGDIVDDGLRVDVFEVAREYGYIEGSDNE